MGQVSADARCNSGKVLLLEEQLSQMPRPTQPDTLDAYTRRRVDLPALRSDECQTDIRLGQPQPIDQLTQVLPAAGIGPVPEPGIEGDMKVHSFCYCSATWRSLM